jgi:hypothetical protein
VFPPVDKDILQDQRKRILLEAGKLIGKVDFTQLICGKPKGIDIVKVVFKEAANVTLQDSNFKDLHSKAWSPQFVQNIRLADIGAAATQQHHFLIETVDSGNPFKPRLNTIDGNLAAGKIQRRTGYHQVGKDNFNYYSQ